MSSSGYDRLYHAFKDINGNEYFIEIFRDNPVTSYEISYSDFNPVSIRYGSGRDKNSWEFTYIVGQELNFKFHIPREDISVIDDLLESEYQDWNVVLRTYESEPDIIFRGFLKPENLYKRYEQNPPYVEVELSATDGLAELKDVDFFDPNGEVITGNPTLLQSIKFALEPTGIPLSFNIQVCTFEAIYTSYTDCILTNSRVNATRFYRNKGGDKQVDAMKCWDVLELILKVFNCKLFQQGDKYLIVDFLQDGERYYWEYNWDLELITFSTIDNNKNINEYLFFPYIEQQKIHPLKSLTISVDNSDSGKEVINAMDWLNYWDFYNWDVTQISPDNNRTLQLFLNSCKTAYMELKTALGVVRQHADRAEYLRIQFDYCLGAFSEKKASTEKLKIQVAISYNDEYTEYVTSKQPPSLFKFQHFDSLDIPPFLLKGDGDYNVKILLDPFGTQHFDYLWLWLDNIQITQYNPSSNSNFDPTTVGDKSVYYQKNSYGFENAELEVQLQDALLKTQDSAILVSTEPYELSSKWSGAPGSYIPIGIKLLDALARKILYNRSIYKNYLRCTIVDRDFTLRFTDIIWIDSLKYVFNNFVYNFQTGELEAELVELVIGLGSYDEIEDVTLEQGQIPVSTAVETNDLINVGYWENHGFNIGDVFRAEIDYLGNVSYYKAQADTIENAKVVGIVSRIDSVDLFQYVSDGYLDKTILPIEINEGEHYYLSPTVAGKIVSSGSLKSAQIKVPIGIGTNKGFQVNIKESITPYNRTSGFLFAGGLDSTIGVEFIDVPESGVFDDSGESDLESAFWFYIEPAEGSSGAKFMFYQFDIVSILYEKYQREWIEIPTNSGTYLIYYDKREESSEDEEDVQVLKYILNPTRDELEYIFVYKCIIATLVLNDELDLIYFGDDRHGSEFNPNVDWWANRVFNGLKESGLTLTNIPESDTSYNGSQNKHAQFGITEGLWHLEDILFEINAVDYTIGFPIMYFYGEDHFPRILIKSEYSVYTVSNGEFTFVQYNKEGESLDSVPDKWYFVMHLFVTNCTIYPIISVMGESIYSFVEDCYINAALDLELVKSYMPQTGKLLIASIVFQASSEYACLAKCRIVGIVTPESIAKMLIKAAQPFVKNGWVAGMVNYVQWWFNNETRELNIEVPVDGYYYLIGEKILAEGTYVISIDDTYGMWYIYIDENNDIIATQTEWDNADNNKVMIATVFWNDILQKALYRGFELHSYEMPGNTRRSMHTTEFCRWVSGLELEIVYNELHITNGILHDEDITANIEEGEVNIPFKQDLTPLSCAKYYLLTESADTKWFCIDDDLTNPAIVIDDLTYYNECSNGIYSLVQAVSGDFICMWLIGTMDANEPLKLISGIEKGSTAEECIINNPPETLYAMYEACDFFCEEWTRYSPIARIILQVTYQPESSESESSGSAPLIVIDAFEDTRDEHYEFKAELTKHDIYVDDIALEITDDGTLPDVDNENNIINIKLSRTEDQPNLQVSLGSMAGFKAWHGNENELPSDRTGTKTIYFVNEEES